MTGITTYASHKTLDFILGRQPFTIPSIFYLAISTTPIGNEGVGITEPLDPQYKRLPITNDKNSFSDATNKIINLIKEYIYPESTVSWGICTHFALYDNNSGGNVWFYGKLQKERDVEIASTLMIEPFENQFSLDICNDADNDGIDNGSTPDMAITTYAANKILNHMWGNYPILIPPENYYVGVSKTPLTIEGVGTSEPSGGNYQRLVLPNNKTTFTYASNKTVTLAKEFRFTNSETAWGNMTNYFISDAPTGGNIWWTGKLLHSRNVEISTTLVLKPDGFKWKLDSCNHNTADLSAVLNLLSLTPKVQYWGGSR